MIDEDGSGGNRCTISASYFRNGSGMALFPPDSEALGRTTWTFLRSTTASYPSGRAPHSARTFCGCCTSRRRCNRSDTAKRTSESPCSSARRTCVSSVTVRYSVLGSVRRTTRPTRCSGTLRLIAPASTSVGGMGLGTRASMIE